MADKAAGREVRADGRVELSRIGRRRREHCWLWIISGFSKPVRQASRQAGRGGRS